METQFDTDKYGGRIFRPGVIPRHINQGITTPNFKLQCGGKISTNVLEDEMYMSGIVMISQDMDIPWYQLPLDKCPSLEIFWEYDVFYPLSRYFYPLRSEDPLSGQPANEGEDCADEAAALNDDEIQEMAFLRSLSMYGEGVLYLNPERHSMMLYMVDPQFDRDVEGCMRKSAFLPEAGWMDGGPEWVPQIKLAQEFSLLPHISPYESKRAAPAVAGAPPQWGGVTPACSSISDMQNRLFRLGFGQMPLFRRAGVLVNLSPSEFDDDEPSTYRLGCIVAHRCGVHGCKHNGRAIAEGEGLAIGADEDVTEDMRCYFCRDNPFYEVLFFNPESPTVEDEDEDEDEDEGREDSHEASRSLWETVPVTASRACHRAVPVGSKLLLSMKTLEAIIPSFKVHLQNHLARQIKAQFREANRDKLGSGGTAGDADNATNGRMKQRAKRMRALMMSDAATSDAGGASSSGSRAPSAQATLLDDTVAGRAALHSAMEAYLVRCHLNVTSVLSCTDGLICVAISCAIKGAKNTGKDVKNIYVGPQDLQIPETDKQWDEALSYIVV